MKNNVEAPVSPEAEASDATHYVGEYLNILETVPPEMMRGISMVRNVNSEIRGILKELEDVVETEKKRPLLFRVQDLLMELQDRHDDKLEATQQQILEPIERRKRVLERLRKNWRISSGAGATLASEKQSSKRVRRSMRVEATAASTTAPDHHNSVDPNEPNSGKPSRRTPAAGNAGSASGGSRGTPDAPSFARGQGRRKSRYRRSMKVENSSNLSAGNSSRRSASASREVSPDVSRIHVDPDEPTYCLCGQISWGQMVMCENSSKCVGGEWFHFSCVSLVNKPKGKWFCPKCLASSNQTKEKKTAGNSK